ncbi:hydantoinase/oxoprolinase N-terminal domain-containing protein [Streptomyces sp. NPDC048411]|uniref:hydantoinase/oxoprolinase N-terminal domain-containing protein n=1 Tax=Streptomyces sp. NPDC048411 TaxID=3157206 RepID=UPI0034539628
MTTTTTIQAHVPIRTGRSHRDLRVGIDVGGTNTDAVVLTGDGKVVARTKQATSADVTTGLRSALTANRASCFSLASTTASYQGALPSCTHGGQLTRSRTLFDQERPHDRKDNGL